MKVKAEFDLGGGRASGTVIKINPASVVVLVDTSLIKRPFKKVAAGGHSTIKRHREKHHVVMTTVEEEK